MKPAGGSKKERRFGVFFMFQRTGMLFVPGTKGGVEHKKVWGWNIPTFP